MCADSYKDFDWIAALKANAHLRGWMSQTAQPSFPWSLRPTVSHGWLGVSWLIRPAERIRELWMHAGKSMFMTVGKAPAPPTLTDEEAREQRLHSSSERRIAAAQGSPAPSAPLDLPAPSAPLSPAQVAPLAPQSAAQVSPLAPPAPQSRSHHHSHSRAHSRAHSGRQRPLAPFLCVAAADPSAVVIRCGKRDVVGRPSVVAGRG